MLKTTFTDLLNNYEANDQLTNELWAEIEKNYSNKNRHYHTLQHLENVWVQLTDVKEKIANWDTILFTLFYHDVNYNPLKSDNEERSAELAEKRMRQLSVPDNSIEQCKRQILATKSHLESIDSDTNYFIDADLSVLGQTWDIYSRYSQNVRKEFSIYPDSVYNPGRKKVLLQFLKMEQLFKTDDFYDKYELQARINMQQELEWL